MIKTVSEYIKQFNQVLEKHGDLPVYFDGCEYGLFDSPGIVVVNNLNISYDNRGNIIDGKFVSIEPTSLSRI